MIDMTRKYSIVINGTDSSSLGSTHYYIERAKQFGIAIYAAKSRVKSISLNRVPRHPQSESILDEFIFLIERADENASLDSDNDDSDWCSIKSYSTSTELISSLCECIAEVIKEQPVINLLSSFSYGDVLGWVEANLQQAENATVSFVYQCLNQLINSEKITGADGNWNALNNGQRIAFIKRQLTAKVVRAVLQAEINHLRPQVNQGGGGAAAAAASGRPPSPALFGSAPEGLTQRFQDLAVSERSAFALATYEERAAVMASTERGGIMTPEVYWDWIGPERGHQAILAWHRPEYQPSR